MIKKLLLTVFFLFLAFVSSKSLFHQGVPITHDGNNHLARFANYYLAVKEFQFPPRLGPNLLNHYGYPAFNYNYPLANILSLPFSFLGFNYQVTFKIINFTFVLLGIYGAYYLARFKKFSKKSSLFAATTFALTPYLITSIVFRGNIGEVMAWGIFPWIFYFLEKIKNEKNKLINKNFFYLFIFLNLLFLAHNIAAFFGSALIIFYLFFLFRKDWQKWKKFISVFSLAFMASLWFWMPAMLEKSLVTLESVDLTLNYYKHFPTLSQLLAAPISFGYSYWSSVDSMSFGIGFLPVILLSLSLIFILRNKKEDKTFYLLSLILFVFQLPFTKVIYDLIPFADFIQFPWRLSLLLSVTLIPVSASLFQSLNKNWKNLLILFLLLQMTQIISIKAIDYQNLNNTDYQFFTDTSSVNKENMPKSFVYQGFTSWEPTAEILEGQGRVEVNKWRGSIRTYKLFLETDALIVEPTAYFAGWQTKTKNLDNANADWIKKEHLDNELIQGRLAYKLDSGNYLVQSRFTQQTWPRLVANSLSGLALLIFFLLFIKWRKDIKENK
jgi:hypothetical protein